MYVDGASNANGSGAGLVLISPEGWDIQYALRFGFPSINNETEYEALVTGPIIAKEMGVRHLKVYSNSRLVVSHATKEYETRENMKQYLRKVKDLIPAFYTFDIQQVSRDENTQADMLSKLATFIPNDLCVQVFFEVLDEPSISRPTPVLQISTEPCWMDLLIQYLIDGSLSQDRAEARKLRNRAA